MMRLLSLLAFACLLALPLRAQEAAEGADGPVLRMEFKETEAIPGQQLSLRLTVLVPTFMPKPPVWPGFETPNVMISLPEKSTGPTSARVDGASWSGLTRHYRISPMVPGEFTLPPQKMRVTYADPDSNAPVDVELTTEEVTFSGVLPAGAEGLDPFIAANALKLEQAAEGEPEGMTPGDSVILTLTATVEGVSPMFLPPLMPQIAVEGIAAYPDEPLVEEKSDRGVVSGTRQERVTLVAEGGGSGAVPPVEVRWYNMKSGQVETATAEGIALSVDGPPARTATPRDWRALILRALAALAVLLAAAAVLRWLWPRLQRAAAALRAAWQGSEAFAYRQVQATLRRRDHAGLLQALEIWDMRCQGNGAAPLSDAAVQDGLLQLGAARYGCNAAQGGDFEEQAAWRSLAAALPSARKTAHKAAHTATAALPPLNPGA